MEDLCLISGPQEAGSRTCNCLKVVSFTDTGFRNMYNVVSATLHPFESQIMQYSTAGEGLAYCSGSLLH